VGQLLEMLKTLGIDKNTLIVFTSDNGAHSEGGHDTAFWNSTGSLRGMKRDLYEGGIRVPFIARWPSVINAGSVSGFVGTGWDVLPTMAELLQQPAPEQCDGVSLLPVFKGEAARQPVYRYWEFWDVLPKGARTKENREKQSMTCQAVRSGKWKAFRGYAKENRENSYQEAPVTEMPIELYDLDADPGESHNLAAQFPEVAARMLSYMEEAHTPLQKPTTAEGVRK
jgi:arylsulfatase A